MTGPVPWQDAPSTATPLNATTLNGMQAWVSDQATAAQDSANAAAASAAAAAASTNPSGPASGDLSGTYPSPTVAKVNGVTVTGTPVAGQVPVASSGTVAAWAAVPVGGAWTAYTPVLTAAATAPNIGTTGTIVGSYSKVGRVVHWKALIQPSGTGISAGSGIYNLTLPFAPASTTYSITGYGWIYNTTFRPVIADGSPSRFILTATGAQVDHTVGLSSSGHVLSVSGTYESAT